MSTQITVAAFRMACTQALSGILAGAALEPDESAEAAVWRIARPLLGDEPLPDDGTDWLAELRKVSDFIGSTRHDPDFTLEDG